MIVEAEKEKGKASLQDTAVDLHSDPHGKVKASARASSEEKAKVDMARASKEAAKTRATTAVMSTQ